MFTSLDGLFAFHFCPVFCRVEVRLSPVIAAETVKQLHWLSLVDLLLKVNCRVFTTHGVYCDAALVPRRDGISGSTAVDTRDEAYLRSPARQRAKAL